MKWKISCLQMNIVYGQPEVNYARVQERIRLAAKAAADLDLPSPPHEEAHPPEEAIPAVILLPELWTTGYDLARLPELADPDGAQTLLFLSSLAQAHRLFIIGGSYARRTGSRIFNTMPFIDRDGQVVGQYDKLHLFGLMKEPQHLQPGDHKGLFRLDRIPCAGVICYDIRFPEWIRAHALGGAEVLFVAAEWPDARLAHWRALLLARAIENQCFVVACNRVGSDPGNRFAGHSLIIDPWGQVIAEAGEEEEILSAVIDLKEVRAARSRIPVFRDRRPDCY